MTKTIVEEDQQMVFVGTREEPEQALWMRKTELVIARRNGRLVSLGPDSWGMMRQIASQWAPMSIHNTMKFNGKTIDVVQYLRNWEKIYANPIPLSEIGEHLNSPQLTAHLIYPAAAQKLLKNHHTGFTHLTMQSLIEDRKLQPVDVGGGMREVTINVMIDGAAIELLKNEFALSCRLEDKYTSVETNWSFTAESFIDGSQLNVNQQLELA
jgi:hypothetical protein